MKLRPVFSISAILISAIFFLLAGCQKSANEDAKSDWYNNPKKIVLAKQGESLSDLAQRLLNQRIDSLGIKLDDYRASYESGPIWISGVFGEPGQPISNVEQHCNSKGQIPIGGEFDGIGCGSDSIEKLNALSRAEPTKFKEYCRSVEEDPSQQTIGYVNTQKHTFWTVNDGQIWGLGISSGKYYPLVDEGSMEVCNLKARADANKWYKPEAFIGNLTGGCSVDEKGPGSFIETLETLHQPYSVKGEVKEGGKVIQTTIEITGRGELMYFRGRARCENYVNSVMSQKEAEKKKMQNKYN